MIWLLRHCVKLGFRIYISNEITVIVSVYQINYYGLNKVANVKFMNMTFC